ncbi:hypothetical protein AGLY_008880 [Aphis glycines]|uniref:Uncharacterized protein n=1 Tax=Aphis glycines TaxID=307491 RepID=A0A6G0TJ22_APHGL|nr:hypothetical protein AGLY_008880 [Aphis glycines]
MKWISDAAIFCAPETIFEYYNHTILLCHRSKSYEAGNSSNSNNNTVIKTEFIQTKLVLKNEKSLKCNRFPEEINTFGVSSKINGDAITKRKKSNLISRYVCIMRTVLKSLLLTSNKIYSCIAIFIFSKLYEPLPLPTSLHIDTRQTNVANLRNTLQENGGIGGVDISPTSPPVVTPLVQYLLMDLCTTIPVYIVLNPDSGKKFRSAKNICNIYIQTFPLYRQEIDRRPVAGLGFFRFNFSNSIDNYFTNRLSTHGTVYTGNQYFYVRFTMSHKLRRCIDGVRPHHRTYYARAVTAIAARALQNINIIVQNIHRLTMK